MIFDQNGKTALPLPLVQLGTGVPSEQKQSFADVFQNRCSQKFRKFHKEIPVSESLFNKVSGFGSATLLNKLRIESF